MKKHSKNGTENEGERGAESGVLRAEIDETRERLSADVDALGNKLSPENIKAEAKQAVKKTVQRGAEQVREGVSSAGAGLMDAVKANPIPVALIGVGLGWLVWNVRAASARKSSAPRLDYSVTGRSGVYDPTDEPRLADDGDGALHQLSERAKDGVDRVKRAASGTIDEAQHQLGKAAGVAKDGARRTRDAAVHTMDDNPLLLGAVALGAGVAVGLSIPTTESENKLVGQYRDRFMAKAKEKAREVGEIAKEAARAAADTGAEKAKTQLRETNLLGDAQPAE